MKEYDAGLIQVFTFIMQHLHDNVVVSLRAVLDDWLACMLWILCPEQTRPFTDD